MNDINAHETRSWNEGDGWEPIGENIMMRAFRGNFDGNNRQILELYIDRLSEDNVGLFGFIYNSEIKNLGLVDINVSGNDKVGGLVGENSNGVVSDSFAFGSVSGEVSVGGLIGYGSRGLVSGSFSSSSVEGSGDSVGGLIGFLSWGEVSNSYSLGDVGGDNYCAGGLVGYNEEGWVSNSYSAGGVNGEGDVGGLVGIDGEYGYVDNSYWDITLCEIDNGVGIGKSTTDMKKPSTFSGWDLSVWEFVSGEYPKLAWQTN